MSTTERTIRLLGNRVLIEVEPRRWPAGRIHLIDRWHPPATGRVVAVGSKVKVPLEAGQRVGFRPMQGTDFEWEGRKLRLLEPTDIVGVLLPAVEMEAGE